MLILLFVFTLIRHLQGVPTANIPNHPGYDPPDIFARDDTMSKHFSIRGVNDIVISCLATIFACTWTAIHPNIPHPCDSGWEIFKRQITTMVYAILAPEMITGWALSQHLAARRIAKEYNETVVNVKDIPPTGSLAERFVGSLKGWFNRKPAPHLAKDVSVHWTITHGFFIQMGGFMMCEGGKPAQIMQFRRRYWGNEYKSIEYHIRKGHIEAPRITEGEIEDRSKGDGLTKAIVVLQTTWFITQCIVRWSSSLPVTELEVLTLGFAMLNGITYALWWHKPQSIRPPVYLEKKGVVGSTTGQRAVMVEREQSQAQDGRSGTPMAVAHASQEAEVMAGQERSRIEQRGAEVEERESQEQHEAGGTRTAAVLVKEEVPPPKRSLLARKLEEDWSTGWLRLWRIPYRIGQAVLRPIAKMLDVALIHILDDGASRVPMFFSAEADNVTVWMASSTIASIFGLIHFIPAFFLDFPSRSEMLLWRISAGIITVQPLFMVILCLQINHIINIGCFAITNYGAPLYIIARLTLIVLALLSLRGLYGNALVTIDWISFIPHF